MKTSISALFLLLISMSAKGDIGHFDIFTISLDGEVYYVPFESPALLKDDLCYYYNEDEFFINASEFIDDILKRHESVRAFRAIDIIDLINVRKISQLGGWIYEEQLHKLSKETILITKIIVRKYEFIDAIRGNTYGYQYTKELNENDNYWLTEYELEYYFDINSDDEVCNFGFFGIKGNLDREEITVIENKIKKLHEARKPIEPFLSKLYKRNIIMLGACSC